MPLALKTLNEGGAFRSLFCHRSKVLVIADFESVTFFFLICFHFLTAFNWLWYDWQYITTNLLDEVVVDGHVTITSLPNQWWIQWGVPGPPTYFQTKLRSEGRKKKFWATPPPPPSLSEGLDPPQQLYRKLPVFLFNWAPRYRQRRAGFHYYVKWRFWSINITMNVFVYTCMK